MKQLCQLVNIHLRSGQDFEAQNLKSTVLQRDSISSVHEAFHEARSLESRLKSHKSQLPRLRLVIKDKSLENIGNNVQFYLKNFFEKDYSTIWEFKILNSEKILVQETVDSQSLKLISDLNLKFPKNTVLFEFQDGFYILDSKKQLENLSPSNIDNSYSLIEYKRIKALQEGIKMLKNQISEFLKSTEDSLQEFKEKSRLNLKSKEIKLSIRGIEALIIENSHQILGIKAKINKVKNVLKSKLGSLQDSRNQGKVSAKNCLKNRYLIINKRNLQFSNFQTLTKRQKELALETRRIFQIHENSNSINGLIPDFFERKEEKMSSAFGLVAHLISVLFSLMNLRPRYPMVLKGSRCSIIDYIAETRSFPMYPLCSKGMDRFRFEYGVFLLNKNIQQLLKYFGIPLKNRQLRNTLHNINLIWKVIEQEPVTPVIIEDSESVKTSLVLMDKRATSPLKYDVWSESTFQNDKLFRIFED